jgi:hypothetical protein
VTRWRACLRRKRSEASTMKAGAAMVAAPTLVSGGKSTLRLDRRFPSICPCTASFTAPGAHDNDPYPEEPREGKLARVVREWRRGRHLPRRP